MGKSVRSRHCCSSIGIEQLFRSDRNAIKYIINNVPARSARCDKLKFCIGEQREKRERERESSWYSARRCDTGAAQPSAIWDLCQGNRHNEAESAKRLCCTPLVFFLRATTKVKSINFGRRHAVAILLKKKFSTMPNVKYQISANQILKVLFIFFREKLHYLLLVDKQSAYLAECVGQKVS